MREDIARKYITRKKQATMVHNPLGEVTGSILTETDNGEYMMLMIYANGSTRVSLNQQYNVSAGGQIGNTATTHAYVNLAANNTIELHQQAASTNTRWYNNGTYGTFGVRLIG